MAECDVSQLLADAKCFACLEPQSQAAANLQLLCNLQGQATSQNESDFIALGRPDLVAATGGAGKVRSVGPLDGPQVGRYAALVTLASTSFVSLAGNNLVGTWTGFTIPAGIQILGDITSFELAGGRVIAYDGYLQ